ncbi:MAG: transcriptional regulator of arginine metabolism [Planctomycetota bacterium]|jgi:transcriptional regulator of arginine metabolism
MTMQGSYTSEDRRTLIRSLLADRQLGSQEELLGALAEKGVRTTQPVLSRDLRALAAVKRDGVYQILEDERVTPLETLSILLRSAQVAGPNMAVVRCEPGAASAIARALDAEDLLGSLGTVAGDDTVFIAMSDADAGAALCARVRELL